MTKQYVLTYADAGSYEPCSVYIDVDLTKQTGTEAAEGWLRIRVPEGKCIAWSLWTDDDHPAERRWLASGTFEREKARPKKKYRLSYTNASREIDACVDVEFDDGAHPYTTAEHWLGANTETDEWLDWLLDAPDGTPVTSGCFKRNWKPPEQHIPVRGETHDDGVDFAKDIAKLKHADAPWWDGFCWQMQQFANDDAFNDYQLQSKNRKHGFDVIADAKFEGESQDA